MVTMIPGDGIGPEISQSVKDIFSAAGVIDGLCTTFLYCVSNGKNVISGGSSDIINVIQFNYHCLGIELLIFDIQSVISWTGVPKM